MRHFLLIAFAWIAVTNTAVSYSPVPPAKRNVFSPNKEYFARIDPQKNKITIHSASSPRRVLWHFDRAIWLEDYFISDSGNVVVVVAWRFVRTDQLDDPALIVYTPKGIELSRSYKDISKPRGLALNEVGPIGPFWKIWRKDAIQNDGSILIEVIGRKPVTVSIPTK